MDVRTISERLLLLGVAWLVAAACPLVAADIEWKTGRHFDAQLAQSMSIYWSKVPLRKALSDLAAARQVAVWLDRRCDPSQLISFRANESLRQCLRKMSEQSNQLDVAWINGVILVGPAGGPNRFATVHHVHQKMVDKLPLRIRKRWQRRSAASWPRLTNPQDVIAQLEREVGTPIQGKERVLHDLWPATNLPPLPAFTRLELILAGFDLTFLLDGEGAARVVEMPLRPRYDSTVDADVLPQVKAIVATQPHAKLDTSQRQARLTASWSVHQAVAEALRPQASSEPTTRLIRYSLRADNQPIGRFAESLAKQLQLRVEFSEESTPYLKRLISFDVKEVDRATLIRTMMKAAGLRYELTALSLRVLGPD